MKVKDLLKKLEKVPNDYNIVHGKLDRCSMCTLTFSNKDLDRKKTFFQRASPGDISSRASLALILSNTDTDTKIVVGDLKDLLFKENPKLDIVVGSSDSQCFCSEFFMYVDNKQLRIL